MNKEEVSIYQLPELAPVLVGADHVDVKSIVGPMTMREFIASMINFQPGWITLLYGVRAVFVRFLAMRQNRVPRSRRMKPENVPMEPGSKAAFFTIRMAEEDRYWVVEADDSHLKATLAVVVEPLKSQQRLFHVATIVHYHKWTGPVYFNVIRPFHHVVVRSMVRAGARQG